jgi:hypothetical protein
MRDPQGPVNRIESLSLATWSRISLMNEFDLRSAYETEFLNESFIEKCMCKFLFLFSKLFLTLKNLGFSRLCAVAVQKAENAPPKTLSAMQAIKLLQHLLLNIYKYNSSLRSIMRRQLTKSILQQQSTKLIPDLRSDCGDARNHVSFLLQILYSIISGFVPLSSEGKEDEEEEKRNKNNESFDPETLYFIRKEILMEILIPLHLPNEMIVWRDQIPVISLFHEDLCRCTIRLIEKCQRPESNSSSSIPFQGSLLTDVIKAILSNWPDAFNTNTPKQVLLLHELEFLLERCSPVEFAYFQIQFLVSDSQLFLFPFSYCCFLFCFLP